MCTRKIVFTAGVVLLASVGLIGGILAGSGCGSGSPLEAGSNAVPTESHVARPEAYFSARPIGGYVPSEVQFRDESLGTIGQWEWDLDGDGIVDSTSRNPRYTYSAPGDYTVTLTVKGPAGESSETREAYLQFTSAPSGADFVASPARGEDGLRVQFTDQSNGYVTAWAWDFDGDGEVDSTEESPTHTYEEYGHYTVSLTITTPDGEHTETKTDFVEYVPSPQASFEGSPTTGEAPVSVQFVDTSTGDIESWQWDFDFDGVVDSTLQNPEYNYARPGTYTVSLTVTRAGGTDTLIRDAYIELAPAPTPTPGPQACTAHFDFEVGEYSAYFRGQIVQFTDTSVGNITGWTWDFGDGAPPSSSQNPSHKYSTNGVHTVTLTITGTGCFGSLTTTADLTIEGCPT